MPLELILDGLSAEEAELLLKEFGGGAHEADGVWLWTLRGETVAAGADQVLRDVSALLGWVG